MDKGTESGSGARKSAGSKGGQKAKPKGKAKRKRKYLSYRGTTKKARKRSPGLIDPNVGVVAKDPLRGQILAVAIQRLYAPSEFAREVGIALNVASHHFKALEKHGIIELVKTERVRGAVKHMYRATESAFIGDVDWGALAQVLRPGVIGATVENFNARVAQAGETGTLFAREDACIYWAPRDLDETAWLEQVTMIKWLIEESDRLEADTVERRANGESDGCFKATLGIFSFPSPTHSEVKAHEEKKRKAAQTRGKRKSPRKGKAKSRSKGGKA